MSFQVPYEVTGDREKLKCLKKTFEHLKSG